MRRSESEERRRLWHRLLEEAPPAERARIEMAIQVEMQMGDGALNLSEHTKPEQTLVRTEGGAHTPGRAARVGRAALM